MTVPPAASAPEARLHSHLRGPWVWRGLAVGQLLLLAQRLTYYVFLDVAGGDAANVPHRVFEELTAAAIGVPLVAGLLWVARRVPLVRARWRRAVAAQGAAFVALTLVDTTAMLLLRRALGPALGLGEYAPQFTAARYAYEAANALLPVMIFVGGLALAENVLAARERERREAALERSLLEAELRALRLQLQPHFLFNALNTISSTMYDDPAAADAQLGELAELLRTSLRTTHAHEVTVREELGLLGQYLGLTRARFGHRLTVEVSAGADTHDCLVPSMLLQPLVENAVRHGALASVGSGRVTVTVARAAGAARTARAGDVTGDRLVVRVHDDGPGAPPGVDPVATGTGLSATARRLRLLYGDAHALRAGAAPEGGFEVRLELPARAAAGPAVPGADARPLAAPPLAAPPLAGTGA